jgi:hypothetical protein
MGKRVYDGDDGNENIIIPNATIPNSMDGRIALNQKCKE